jgi:hypothetical protein
MENLSLTAGVSRPRWRDLILLTVIPAIAVAVSSALFLLGRHESNDGRQSGQAICGLSEQGISLVWSSAWTLRNYAHYLCTIKSDALRVNHASNFHGVQTAVANGHDSS